MTKRRLWIAFPIIALAGCSQGGYGETHGIKDAPVEPADKQNNGPAHIITMPDGFQNIAFKCDGKNGIYTHTRVAAPVIVANDPNCAAPRG